MPVPLLYCPELRRQTRANAIRKGIMCEIRRGLTGTMFWSSTPQGRSSRERNCPSCCRWNSFVATSTCRQFGFLSAEVSLAVFSLACHKYSRTMLKAAREFPTRLRGGAFLRDRQENSGFRGTIPAAIAALLKDHEITWPFECPIAPHLG